MPPWHSRIESGMPHGDWIDLIVDSTGLQVCDQGKWHSQKHGEKKRKLWKKLHIGVDSQGWIIASRLTESHAQDPSQVPTLFAQVNHAIGRFIGDGIYDQKPVYTAGMDHAPGARVTGPPRKDSGLSPEAEASPTQCDQHLVEIGKTDWFQWKRTSGYDDQAQAENAFARFKRVCSGWLRAKRDASTSSMSFLILTWHRSHLILLVTFFILMTNIDVMIPSSRQDARGGIMLQSAPWVGSAPDMINCCS